NTSINTNPSNVFSEQGEYKVRLAVTANNGCQNLTEQTISIFSQPIAGFTFPSLSQYCTNQEYTFENISSADSGYPVTWLWQVNGVNVSTDENLLYTVNSVVDHEIKLIATIPGCSSEVSQVINSVNEGPLVDFSFVGQCQDAPVTFTNET